MLEEGRIYPGYVSRNRRGDRPCSALTAHSGKYDLAESDIQVLLLTLIHKGNCVSGELALKGIAPDPGDDKIISCAIEGEAEFIVTGDKALQQLKEYQAIKIINAEQFIRVLRE
jgi:uncharacterized protein